MANRFETPIYNVTTAGGESLAIDVTNSISAGLPANGGFVDHILPWMKKAGATTVLDFGAGALRHALPLLKAGYQVIAVEYERAYTRRRAGEFLELAREYDGFTQLVWPNDFLKCRHRYDVALLMYVLQVVPVKKDREVILEAIGKRFSKDGPKRLYYASRHGEGKGLPKEARYNDGWVRGRGTNDRSFYAEFSASETDEFFERAGYNRAGSYSGPTQPFLYDYHPGVF